MIVPFLWITAAAVGIVHGTPAAVPVGPRYVACACATAYGFCLSWLGGLVSPVQTATTRTTVMLLPPWWGPVVSYTTPLTRGVVFPYCLFGYVALVCLVYVATTHIVSNGRGRSKGIGGLVGLVTCAGCAAPVVTPLIGLTAGTAAVPAVPTVGTIAYLIRVCCWCIPVANTPESSFPYVHVAATTGI